ncbi:MAG: 2-oxoglutarate dehydrogenase E1 component [Phycisphaerales bacterium]
MSTPSTPISATPASLNGWNAEYLGQLHQQFLTDPASLAPDIRAFMQGFDLAAGRAPAAAATAPTGGQHETTLALKVAGAVHAFRTFGHFAAATDPFGRTNPNAGLARIAPGDLGLSEGDLSRPAFGHGLPLASGADIRAVLQFLSERYVRSTGYQFMHITDPAQRAWFIERIERRSPTEPTRQERLEILECLCRSEQMERFLQKRYQGQKRFSLEGGEALIPLMDWAIRTAGALGVEEVVVGMPHRGRINVLNNVMGKTYEQIFTEFEHNYHEDFIDGGGDVKYHRGYSGERTLGGKKIALTLSFNPSHLESVNGVVEGRTRAKQRLRGDTDTDSPAGQRARRRVMPMLIHGDAAVIAQGVVAEVLNYSQLEGYRTGGTLHAVINNLVGFTTDPEDGRSSPYCTDMALMIEAPVIHVNGDDPEAVVNAARLAVEYRQEFGRDVFIDMVCYRKYGHNETDNASITQPILSDLVKNDTGVLSHYMARLQVLGVISAADVEALHNRLEETLEAAQRTAKASPHQPNIDPAGKRWKGMTSDFSHAPAKTAVSADSLREVCAALGRAPAEFTLNPVSARTMAARAALAEHLGKDAPEAPPHLTYGDAESLAFGTLLLEGTAVRVSGQDARRGTFSHRHAVMRDARTGAKFTPLNAMRPISDLPDNAGKPGKDGNPTQARLCVYDSPLSEYGVMAFDYGYSMADPNMLVCWEAQFGDFANTSQVIIDQYLASAEIKWDRWSGLVLMLPHGYEGQGPEHSSARLERFLMLCADDNIQVVYPSTGAQIFHVLRRQVKRAFRKPLIIMTPKSMLRLPTSRMDDLTRGGFEEIIDDPHFASNKEARRQVSRVIFCSGKFFHELAKRRDDLKRFDTAILRVEQFYPFHHDLAREILGRYPAKVTRYWAQEEPRNAGAFSFMDALFRHELKFEAGLSYFGREASATPAVGDTHVSDEQQETILTKAIGPLAGAAHPHPTPEVAKPDGKVRR